MATIIFGIFILVMVMILITTIVITPQHHVRMIETFGKYSTVKRAGLSLKLPFPFQTASRPFSLQTRQIVDSIQVKSSNNVFVKMPVNVQFRVIPDQVKEAYYELEDPEGQMRAYIVSEIRSISSKMSFQDLYDDKEQLSNLLQKNIIQKMHDYGYRIIDVLVDDPQPSEDIIRAYNDVTVSERSKEAAIGYAETDRIRRVAEAEATGEAQRISAEATVLARKIMAEGNAEAIKKSVEGTSLGQEYGHHLVEMSINAESIRDAARHGGRTVVVTGGGVSTPTAAHGLYAGNDVDEPLRNGKSPQGKVCSLDKNGDGIVDLN